MKNLLQKLKWFLVPKIIKTLTHYTATNHKEIRHIKRELYKIKGAISDVDNSKTRGTSYSKRSRRNVKKEVTKNTGKKA